MNYLPLEIKSQIDLFNSHTFADMLTERTIETMFQTYMCTGSTVKMLHNMIQVYADDFFRFCDKINFNI